MGAIISLLGAEAALITVGVMSAMAAQDIHYGDTKSARKWTIYSAIIAFVVAVLTILIAILFL